MKRIISIVLALCLLMCLVACGKNDVSELEKRIAQLEAENEALREALGDSAADIVVNGVEDNTTEDTNPENSGSNSFNSQNLGDTVSLDFVEFSIDKAYWCDDLCPADTSGVYSYYEGTPNESFFVLSGKLKNTSGGAYDVECITAKMVFDKKYIYDAQLAADNGGNDFWANNVNPLASVNYYIYASIPDELKDTYTTCDIRFGFDDNFEGFPYILTFDDCKHFYSVTVTREA